MNKIIKTGFKKIISAFLSIVLTAGVVFSANAVSIDASAQSSANTTVAATSFWSGNAAQDFADGSGTKDDPFIIETADQLYLALTKITGTTGNVEKIESVAGGYQSDKILKEGSTTVYMPVYTPYYYKVADGVVAFYLNNISEKESLQGIKDFVNNENKKIWKPREAFVGHLDGNGVTIYGMYSDDGSGLIYKLDGGADVRNINFDSCYSSGTGNAAILTTRLGSYYNDSTIHTVSGISVRNSFIASTRDVNLKERSSGGLYEHSPAAAGLISTGNTCEALNIKNCMYDGITCERMIISTVDNVTNSMIGGIISGGHSMNNVSINESIALGAPVVDEVYVAGKEVFYNRYDANQGYRVFIFNCYSDVKTQITTAYPNKYDKLLNVDRLETKDKYNLYDMPKLNWRTDWQFCTFDNREIPMPQKSYSKNDVFYSKKITEQNNLGGACNVLGGAYYPGTYGMYHTLTGSGTEADPYIINDAFELARAIASGGVNIYNKLYYKLACDIDVSNAKWITQQTILNTGGTATYKYVPFAGVLDGDGHTVKNIFAGDDSSVGLVPVLASGGVIKNLHVRNSCFVSGKEYAGVIAGEVQHNATITGCSVENSMVICEPNTSYVAGNSVGTIKNSYYLADENADVENETLYYNANGEIADINVTQNDDIWYLGGKDGSTPKLKNYAAAQQFADIDGDGIANSYGAADVVALRRRLLLASGYENAYCDVNRDGKVNISDLGVLSRSIVGDYDKLYDGFWRNAQLGKISIYYGENDNYDAARRLELYLEQELFGVDIKKVVSANKTVSGTNSDKDAVYVHSSDSVGSPKGSLEIIVGNIANYSDYSENNLNTNDYSISYDESNCVLWFNGGSFTGVEQAVLDFIANSNEKTNTVYTVETATLAPEKRAKTVYVDTNYDGKADTQKVMYYAWGDEFDGVKENAAAGENAELSLDVWGHAKMRTETDSGCEGNYNNVESVNEEEISQLYWVENGRLTITRGIKAEHATAETDALGYVRLYNQEGSTAFKDEIDDQDIIANPGLIKTNHSMLYKQGYAEMYGALPSDGHTFASWWMLGHGSFNNYAIEETLFSKVYKPNNTGKYAYDGTTAWPISTDLKTFKYQIPTNHFEIDVWELMQNPARKHSYYNKTSTTGSYEYSIYLNIHKFYAVGSRNQSIVNVIDWENPETPIKVMQKEWFGTPEDDYYFSSTPGRHDFSYGTTNRFTKDWFGRVTANYNENLQKQFTAPRRYGFYWSTNGVDKFNFTLYIYDANGDGVEGDDVILGTSDITYNTQDGMIPKNYDCVDDAVVANQYMYFLFDNVLYTSNPYHNNSTDTTAVMHTDMLTNNGTTANPDKIDLDIDYIRVYQYDGRRDVVTKNTEDFNNGNHFGY